MLISARDIQHLNQNYSEEVPSPPVPSAELFNVDTALSRLGRYRFIKGVPIPISSCQRGTCCYVWSWVCWHGGCTHHRMQQDGQKDIRERKGIHWLAESFERAVFYHGPPTWTSVHCAASVHFHSLSVEPGRAASPLPIVSLILWSPAIWVPSSRTGRAGTVMCTWETHMGALPTRLLLVCLHLLTCWSIFSVTVSPLSTAREEVPWMIDAESCGQLSPRSVCFYRAYLHLWFVLSFLSPSAPLPSTLLLSWGWWSGKADLSPQGEFALLMHRTQCCTSESYCMLHCKHGGRHLAASSKGCSLWIFSPIFIKSDIDILHWSKTMGLDN